MAPYVDHGLAGFQHDVELKDRAAVGKHANEGAEIPSAWQHLAKGATIGKRVVYPFKAGDSVTGLHASTPLNLLQIRAVDDYEEQLSIILCPPQIINGVTVLDPNDVQNLSGEATNIGVGVNTNSVFLNPTAIVEWGAGGVSCIAEVDFINGANINLCASYVRVSAVLRRLAISSGALVLSAFIGPGRPKTIGAQKTINLLLNKDGTSAFTPVPAFAKEVFLTGYDIVDESALFTGNILFYDGTGVSGVGLSQFQFTPTTNSPIRIPNGAAYFRVINKSSVAHEMFINAIFDLSI